MVTDGLTPITLGMFFGLAGGTVLLAVMGVAALVTHHHRVATGAAVLWLLGAGTYALLLLGSSQLSKGTVLALGDEKHICNLDCHLAYSVLAVNHPDPEHVVATVRVRFDPETIAPWRGDAPLEPFSPRACLTTASGGCQAPEQGDRPFDRALRPGEEYSIDLTFRVPDGAAASELEIFDDSTPNQVIIGHEMSIGHAHTTFRLGS